MLKTHPRPHARRPAQPARPGVGARARAVLWLSCLCDGRRGCGRGNAFFTFFDYHLTAREKGEIYVLLENR